MRLRLSDGTEDNLWTDLNHEPRHGDLISTQHAVYQVVESQGGDLVGIQLEDESIK